MKKIIIASSSTVHGSGYLEYLQAPLLNLFKDCKKVLFIPYARPSGINYDAYTQIAKEGFSFMDIEVVGIHETMNPKKALYEADAIFVGGGNTFVLVNELYKYGLIDVLKQQIDWGIPYLGTSAGSNICGVSMQTTNDMPIVYPPSFKTLNAIPFNVNAHYLKADKNSTHKGETRETRIKEYHVFNDTPVLGLQEGSWLEVFDKEIILNGSQEAYWFEKNKEIKTCLPKMSF